MPELPEVQTMATDLDRNISGKKIVGIWFDWPKMIHIISSKKNIKHHPRSIESFEKELKNLKIKSVKRRAKNVLINLSNNTLLAIHPRMTGHFVIGKWKITKNKPVPISAGALKEKINSYIHFLIEFSDGDMLGFSDARKFGKIIYGWEEDVINSKELKDLGPEPLSKDLDLEIFKNILSNSRGNIKSLLLNQKKISGIGNIYADESLFKARINPLRKADTLSDEEIKRLYKAIENILLKAIKLRGTSMSDYRDALGEKGEYMKLIKVYGRKGKECKTCGTEIKRIVIGSRGTHYCPKCQG